MWLLDVRLIILDLNRKGIRVIFLLAVFALVSLGFFNLYQQFRGLALAAMYKDIEGLQSALRCVPQEAEVHEELGTIYLLDPEAFDPERALEHFTRAVQASPFDSRLWIGLGRAYEQCGKDPQAARSYLRAIELAPQHFRPRWIYANFLLRSGQREKALVELSALAQAAQDALENISNLIWQATGEDAQALVTVAATLQPQARVTISNFLLSHKRYQEGLEIWRSLPWGETKIESARRIISSFLRAREWLMAYALWREITKAIHPEAEERELLFWNARFNYPVTNVGYDWYVKSSDQVSASIDETTGLDDSRSLMLEFRKHEEVNYSGTYHYLLVEPSTAYVLRFFYKTQDMLPKNGIFVEVADAESKQRLRAQTAPLEDASDWTERTVSFSTPPETKAVVVTISRQPVSRLYDYVAGKIWFDSFALERQSQVTDH